MNRNGIGQFKPGQSGNPGGRPKVISEIQDLARQHTKEAFQTLLAICKDEKANPSARVAASLAIIERGYGKAPQAHTGENGEGPIIVHILKPGEAANVHMDSVPAIEHDRGLEQ